MIPGCGLSFVAGLVLGVLLTRHWFFVYIDMHPGLKAAYEKTGPRPKDEDES